ncbi:MAG: RNA-binding protein [Patescibacteria group bacterium]
MEEKNRLYVGNLDYAVSDDKLAEIFNALEGIEVTDAKVIVDKFSDKSKGFGFVTVANEEMAETAIRELNGKEVEGRALTVSIARPKAEQTDRQDSRGGDRRGYGRSYR